jgi:hypothetical protein
MLCLPCRWSLKWNGHAPQGEGRGNRHAIHTAKQSIEIVRRFRTHNPNLAGIMPFEAPFYYCGDNVTSFGDLTTHDPTRGFYGPSDVQMQEQTSFAPVLLSIELWTPHRYIGHPLSFTAHVVNDADDGADLPSSTLHWSLAPATTTYRGRLHGVGEHLAVLKGRAPVDAVRYYSTASKTVSLELAAAAGGGGGTELDVQPGRYALQTELRAPDGMVIASNEESVELFAQRPTVSSGSLGELLGSSSAQVHASVLLYEPSGSRTQKALHGVGVSVKRVDAAGLKQVLQQHANATTIVIGENSWDQALESLAQELRSYVDTGPAAGRIVLLQQSQAPTNLSLGWAPGGAVLRLYPTSQYIMHSGLTVGRGRPVHPTRTDHPVFSHPNALGRDHFLSWNDPWNWTESAVDTGVGRIRPTPSQSPMALGVFINSTNLTSEIAANEAALNRVDVLLGHAMGLQNIVLAELAGRHGGGVLFCGLGIADRAGGDPVTDRLLENMLAYYASGQQPAMAPGFASASRSLHPMIESGHTVIWGNYSTERGLVRTDVNGLIVRPCSFDQTCGMNGLGNVPCGRSVTGPFTWTCVMVIPLAPFTNQRIMIDLPCLTT